MSTDLKPGDRVRVLHDNRVRGYLAGYEGTVRWGPNETSGVISYIVQLDQGRNQRLLVFRSDEIARGNSSPDATAQGQAPRRRPLLTVEQVLSWMEAHHRRTGRWPDKTSGVVLDAPRENWRALDSALRRGYRSFPGEQSLRQLRNQLLGS